MAHLIIGGGYLGGRVARLWRDAGKEVYVVTRSDARAARLEEEGLRPVVADITQPDSLDNLPPAETLLFAVGYDRSSRSTLHDVYVAGLKNVLEVVAGQVEKFVYISTTGVYGPGDGEWVDEDSPCRPTRPGAVAHLEAESLLHATDSAGQAVILRLAGIYGPGRLLRKTDLVAGRPIEGAERGWINLIHVDDAASVVSATEQIDLKRTLLLVADGHPVQRHDFYLELARLLDAPAPSFADPQISRADDQRRWAPGKRVRNRRLLSEFSLSLRFPTYREGLASIVQQEME